MFALTGVKPLWVLPLLLIMVQSPQVDDDSSSPPHCETSNAAETRAHSSLMGLTTVFVHQVNVLLRLHSETEDSRSDPNTQPGHVSQIDAQESPLLCQHGFIKWVCCS